MNTATLSASLWDRSTSWAWIKQKTEEIKKSIGYGGVRINTDDGIIWIKLPETVTFSAPFDSGEDTVKRMRMTFEVDIMTT